jgi:hypothetical protein
MRRLIGMLALAAVCVASCSDGGSRPAAGGQSPVGASPPVGAVGPLKALDSAAVPRVRPGVLQRRAAVALSPTRLEFAMGGSGTCAPVAKAAAVRGDELVVPVRPAHSVCTTDLVFYTVVVTLNRPVLANRNIKTLETGYSKPYMRLRIVRS